MTEYPFNIPSYVAGFRAHWDISLFHALGCRALAKEIGAPHCIDAPLFYRSDKTYDTHVNASTLQSEISDGQTKSINILGLYVDIVSIMVKIH